MPEKNLLGVWIEVKTTTPGKWTPAFFRAAGIAKEHKNSITFNQITSDGIEKVTVEKKHIISTENVEEE